MANRTKRTLKKETQFLKNLRSYADVSKACRAIGVARSAVYRWRAEDEVFASSWDDALAEGIEAAEGEAYRRAVKGTLKPVFHQGQKVGSIREYSDALLMFLLKAAKPEKFRERYEHKHQAEITANIIRLPAKQTTEEWIQSQQFQESPVLESNND